MLINNHKWPLVFLIEKFPIIFPWFFHDFKGIFKGIFTVLGILGISNGEMTEKSRKILKNHGDQENLSSVVIIMFTNLLSHKYRTNNGRLWSWSWSTISLTAACDVKMMILMPWNCNFRWHSIITPTLDMLTLIVCT